MRTAGTVILYNPDKEAVLSNIRSYLHKVDVLFIIDNSTESNSEIADHLLEDDKAVVYLQNDFNEGIAVSINKAIQLAAKHDCTWLLTMDQDSHFEPEQADRYWKQVAAMDLHNIAVIGPAHSLDEYKEHEDGRKEVVAVITSGSMVHVQHCIQLGGFTDKLFIDEVDHEFCYRARVKGFSVIECNNVLLSHQLGHIKYTGYAELVNKSARRLHSPSRLYFMVRNYFYVRERYAKIFPGEFVRRDKEVMVALKNNLLFSGHFFTCLKKAIKGFLDYKRGNFTNTI